MGNREAIDDWDGHNVGWLADLLFRLVACAFEMFI